MTLAENIENLNQSLTGSISPAVATPINRETGELQIDVIPQLVDFLIARGVGGLFVGGTTGEGVFLDSDQRRKLHEISVSVAGGRVPVMVHAGALQTETAVELALLIGSSLLILIVELLNSAVENVVDRIGTERHVLSKQAKDLGSAAAAISMLTAVIVWGLIAYERFM